jgi:prepilin-type processing-associated H-X9-DG protein
LKKYSLVVGGVGLLVLLILILPPIYSNREKWRMIHCSDNMKGIGLCIAMYADTHDNHLPPTLDALNIPKPTRVFFCPSAKDRTHYSYELTGITNIWQSDPDVIILREHPGNHRKGGNALFNDGHVQWISGPAAFSEASR